MQAVFEADWTAVSTADEAGGERQEKDKEKDKEKAEGRYRFRRCDDAGVHHRAGREMALK